MEVCRLCLDLATESDVKKLEGTYRDATQIVLPEVNTDISSSPVICQQCTSSLDELYTFKASVVEAENQIKEKVGDDKCQLRLKEVMTGVQMDEKNADLGKSKDRMCRTCLCAIEGETFTVLKPSQSDAYLNSMLLMCLPEMDLELTLDPVMCEQCLCNLQKLYHFKSSCLDVEERLNNYCQQHGTSSASQINLHSVLEEDAAEPKDNIFGAVKSEPIDSSVKSEEDDEDVSMSDNSKDLGYTVVKVKKEERDMMLKEEDDTEDGDESMGDDADNMSDEEIGELKQEELKIEDDDGDGTKKENDSQLVQCKHCDFKTSYIGNLKRHMQTLHTEEALSLLECVSPNFRPPGEQNMGNHTSTMKCEYCEFTTRHKRLLKTHMKKYHKKAEIHAKCRKEGYRENEDREEEVREKEYKEIESSDKVYTCTLCDYKSTVQRLYYAHIKKKHRSYMKKCEFCSFVALSADILAEHLHTHITQLKCPLCDFVATTSQTELTMHRWLKHRDTYPYRCKDCDYATKTRRAFISHMKQKHSGECEVDAIKDPVRCNRCSITLASKDLLTEHMETVHKSNKYICPKCNYKCSFIIPFAEHNLTVHKTVTTKHNLELFTCSKCNLKTYDRMKLDGHEKNHRFECPKCRTIYSFLLSLKEHMLKKHNMAAEDLCKLYRCRHCEFKTFEIGVWRAHSCV